MVLLIYHTSVINRDKLLSLSIGAYATIFVAVYSPAETFIQTHPSLSQSINMYY